jgi:hypothetical protein
MKKLILPVLVVFAVSACGDSKEITYTTKQEIRTFCDETETKKAVADFTLQCIKNANPISDEEPEDWILLCKRMAAETFCEAETVIIHYYREPSSSWLEEYRVERVDNEIN